MQTETNTNVPATASDVAPVTVQPEAAKPAKPVRKPRAKANAKPVADAKAAKRAKAAKPAKPARDNSERVALIGKLRTTVARVYNGPSLSVRSTVRSPALAAYAELFASPKHRTTRDKLTPRDNSALRLIADNGGNGQAGFDPVKLNLDRGNFSRLASCGLLETAPNGLFRLSADGRAHAKRVAPAKAA